MKNAALAAVALVAILLPLAIYGKSDVPQKSGGARHTPAPRPARAFRATNWGRSEPGQPEPSPLAELDRARDKQRARRVAKRFEGTAVAFVKPESEVGR